MISRTMTLVLAAAAAAALTGCGKQSLLERPAPLFGKTAPQEGRWASERDASAARARTDGKVAAGPQAPQSVDEVRDAGPNTAALSQAPNRPPNPDAPSGNPTPPDPAPAPQ